MAPNYESELLKVVTEGLKDIRDEIAGLREEIALIVQRQIELDGDCKLCRTVINGRIVALEDYQKRQESISQRKAQNKQSMSIKVLVAIISIIGMFLVAFTERWLNG